MKITEGRRLAAILAIYSGIFSLYVWVPQMRPFALPIGLFLTLVFAAALLIKNKKFLFSGKKAVLVLLAVLSLVSALQRGAGFVRKTETVAKKFLDDEPHCATGYITEIVYEANYGSSYALSLLSVDQKDTNLGIRLILPYNGDFSVGDTLTFEAMFSEPEREYGVYRKADGIFLYANSEFAEKTGEREIKKVGFFENIRLTIKENFETYIKEDCVGFATALMTGNRDGLGGRLRLSFTRIGISHILAVSGLHLSIVIGGLDFFLRLIAIPRKAKNVVLIVCTFFFACICGLSASIVRAAVMHAFLYIADTIGERNDSPTSLFVAIFLIMFVNPRSVYDVGMWMSFLATLGILATVPIVSQITFGGCPRLVRKALLFIVSLICMTVSAVFFTLPVTWLAFGGISILSPFANLIFIPLTQIILYLLIILTVVSFMPFLASMLGDAAEVLIDIVFDLAEALSDMKGIYVSLRYPFVAFVIAVLIAGILAVLFIKKVKVAYLFAVFAICTVIYGAGYFGYMQIYRESAYVYLQTDGKSDAVGIVSGNETVVVDISTGGYSVLSDVMKQAEDFYACEIDVLVLTHYHSYHANTLRRLTEQIKIRRILVPEPSTEKEYTYYSDICSVLGDFVETERYQTDETQKIEVRNAVLTLHPAEYIGRSTHPIVRFSATVGEKSFGYLGESATETDFSDMKCDVVVFGSHGPVLHHIFDSAPFASAELVIFTDEAYAELTETETLTGAVVFAEDYGGRISILFE